MAIMKMDQNHARQTYASIPTQEYRRLQAIERAHRQDMAAATATKRDVDAITRGFNEAMINSMAADLRRREPNLTKEQAYARVAAEHPDLFETPDQAWARTEQREPLIYADDDGSALTIFADAKMAANPQMTREQAELEVFSEKPGLYDAYVNRRHGGK